jgi:hypothetical protein
MVTVDWVAVWDCPCCQNQIDSNECDVDFSDRTANIKCTELVDKGGFDLVQCGHEYKISRG